MGFFSSLLVLTVLRDVALLLLSVAGTGGPGDRARKRDRRAAAGTRRDAGRLRQRAPGRAGGRGQGADSRPATAFMVIRSSRFPPFTSGPRSSADLNAIVTKVNALKPDAIAITGDLVDGSVQRLAMHTPPLEPWPRAMARFSHRRSRNALARTNGSPRCAARPDGR